MSISPHYAVSGTAANNMKIARIQYQAQDSLDFKTKPLHARHLLQMCNDYFACWY